MISGKMSMISGKHICGFWKIIDGFWKNIDGFWKSIDGFTSLNRTKYRTKLIKIRGGWLNFWPGDLPLNEPLSNNNKYVNNCKTNTNKYIQTLKIIKPNHIKSDLIRRHHPERFPGSRASTTSNIVNYCRVLEFVILYLPPIFIPQAALANGVLTLYEQRV